MTQFIEDCKKAREELDGLIKHLEDQRGLVNTLNKMNLNDEQKKIFAGFFLDED